jgi:hypothetical protein
VVRFARSLVMVWEAPESSSQGLSMAFDVWVQFIVAVLEFNLEQVFAICPKWSHIWHQG